MIYNKEECDLLLNISLRKTVERSIISKLDDLPIAFRSAMDCQLELDLQRCDAM